MLARHPLPATYESWNREWSAPAGRYQRIRKAAPKLYDLARKASPRLTGPFSLQDNDATRAFEFPWAYEAIAPAPGMKILEVGGSLAGLQFALARAGAEVTNVDPGEKAKGMGWPVDQRRIDRLNRSFGTQVSLINSTLGEAAIGGEVFDAVVSVSTIEHIPATDHPSLMAEIARVLKPRGRCVLTVDLFLNLQPFSDRVCNQYGTNADIAQLVGWSGLTLTQGERTELYGFPEFDPRAILASLEHSSFGGYPVCAQCLVLTKAHG